MNRYILYTITGQAIWGIQPLFWANLPAMPSLYILATRIVWAAIFCYALIVYKHLLPDLRAVRFLRREWAFMIGACLAVTMNWGAFIYAMTHGAIIQTSLAYFMSPIVVILCGSLIYREHLGRLQQLAIAFASTGLLIAFIVYGQIPYLALFLCVTWAAYGLLKKRISVNSQVSVFLESAAMVPLSLAFIAYCELTQTGAGTVLSGWQWLLLPATGIVTATPMIFFTAGIQGTPITVSGILMYLAPSISLCIGLFKGEILTTPLLITFVFTWLAVICYVIGLVRKN